MPASGIYLFSEGGNHLYVGRSRDMRERLRRHCRPRATHLTGPFALHLAREATNNVKATYKKEGSRAALMRDPDFCAAFDVAKARIRKMDIRFIAEPDPIRQAVLEIYVAVVLETPYNDFDTH